MISEPSTGLRLKGGVIRAGVLRGLRRRGRLPDSVTIAGPGDREIVVRTSETRAGFRGWRGWFSCPLCVRRTPALHVLSDGLACRRCAAIPYESRQGCGAAWWRRWGRAVHRLARVRAELARRYLRLSRRGQLERLEARLVDEVCRGLAAEQHAVFEWEAKARCGAWFGVLPYGLGYDWDDAAGGVVPTV